MFQMLMDPCRVDFWGFRSWFSKELLARFDFTTTQEFSSAYYRMGYETRNPILNVGPLNVCVLTFVLCFIVQIVFSLKCWDIKDYSRALKKRMRHLLPQSFLIRFFLLYFPVLALSGLISILNIDGQGFTWLDTQKQGGSAADERLGVYAYFLLILMLAFMIMTAIFGTSMGKKIYTIMMLER